MGGVGEPCCITFVHVLELLPALQNCLAPREQGLITFHDGGCAAFPAYMVCLTSVRIWCPGILKIYFICFCFQVRVMSG